MSSKQFRVHFNLEAETFFFFSGKTKNQTLPRLHNYDVDTITATTNELSPSFKKIVNVKVRSTSRSTFLSHSSVYHSSNWCFNSGYPAPRVKQKFCAPCVLQFSNYLYQQIRLVFVYQPIVFLHSHYC